MKNLDLRFVSGIPNKSKTDSSVLATFGYFDSYDATQFQLRRVMFSRKVITNPWIASSILLF